MFNYSSVIYPFRNTSNVKINDVPRGHVRIGAEINASRTMRDKANQRKIAGKTVTRVAWFHVAPNMEISVWSDKQGRFSFGDGYVDVPFYQARKLGILGDYMSVQTVEGTFSKKQQNEMSKPHNWDCRCFGDRCIIPF